MAIEFDQAFDDAMQNVVGDQTLLQSALTTVLAVFAVLLIRYFVAKFVKGQAEIYDKDQRRWLNRINNGTILSIVVMVAFIWAPQIHTFLLSITAFAVAVVLTFREILACLTGGILRATSKSFEVGDWITIDGSTGEVIEITPLATTIEEIETTHHSYQFTGRTIQVPNSRFLTANAENANFLKNYVYRDISITVHYGDFDPDVLMSELRRIAEKHYSPFREAAAGFIANIEKKTALDFADPEPKYFLRTRDDGHNIFVARMFLPTRQSAEIGTGVTQEFLKFVYDAKHQAKERTDDG